MAGSDFQVNIPSGFSSPDVRILSDTEKSMAGAMGLSEEQFRQSKLEYLLGEERRRNRGHDLGEQVEKILAELGTGYRLTSVTWNSNTWNSNTVELEAGDRNAAGRTKGGSDVGAGR